jgi:hypothetical protein
VCPASFGGQDLRSETLTPRRLLSAGGCDAPSTGAETRANSGNAQHTLTQHVHHRQKRWEGLAWAVCSCTQSLQLRLLNMLRGASTPTPGGQLHAGRLPSILWLMWSNVIHVVATSCLSGTCINGHVVMLFVRALASARGPAKRATHWGKCASWHVIVVYLCFTETTVALLLRQVRIGRHHMPDLPAMDVVGGGPVLRHTFFLSFGLSLMGSTLPHAPVHRARSRSQECRLASWWSAGRSAGWLASPAGEGVTGGKNS